MRTFFSSLAILGTVAVAGPVAAADKLNATYKFYWKGFLVSQADTSASITSDAYEFALDFRMRGVASIFASGRSSAKVSGLLRDRAPVPQLYENSGRWDGKDFAQTMTFDGDGALLENKLDWPEKWLEEFKREPVPKELQVGPDPASLVISLIHTPLERAIGEEPLVMRTFDGDSVLDWIISCSPEPVELEESGKSPYAGEAYECTYDGKLVAGKRILTEKQKKKREKEREKARKKAEKRRKKGQEEEDRSPKIWMQAVEGSAYILPVRAEFQSGLGRVRMYLSDLQLDDQVEDGQAVALNEAPLQSR